MTDNEKINGWTFEETVKSAENLMEVEKNMFKWDVLRHLRDFAEMYKEEVQRYRALGTVEELKIAKEKQIPKKPYCVEDKMWCCPVCDNNLLNKWIIYNIELMPKSNGLPYCLNCGQKLDWSDEE